MKMVVSEGFVIISENVLQMFSEDLFVENVGEDNVYLHSLSFVSASITHTSRNDQIVGLFYLFCVQASRHPDTQSHRRPVPPTPR
jgi:hypothetical protein